MYPPPPDHIRAAPRQHTHPPFWSACADEPLVARPPYYAPPSHAMPRDTSNRSRVASPPSPVFDDAPASIHRRPVSREERAALRQPVYVIRCSHCDTFFTDRGMKAVLLLKPHVTLYSTDAMPSNCAAAYAPEPALGDLPDYSGVAKERTCNCLTQTLACQGCGSVVGYNVVSPCSRCSSNVSKHSRGHNGHRIVFHCADIAAHERRYLPGDRGVRSMSVPPILSSLLKERDMIDQHLRYIIHEDTDVDMQQYAGDDDSDDSSISESSESSHSSGASSVSSDDDARAAGRIEWSARRGQEYMSLGERKVSIQQEIRIIYARLLQQYQAGARMLLAGETVYWSDLSETGGERTQPFDPELYLSLPMAGR